MGAYLLPLGAVLIWSVNTVVSKLAADSIVILLSHRLYLFPQMDQIIWMEDGKTVVGTHEELLVKVPEYKKLFTEEGGAESEDRQK